MKYLLQGLLLSLLFVIGCAEKDEIIDAKITLQSEKSIIFSPEEPESQKTFLFHSTKSWQLAPTNVDWLQITPESGNAGDNQLIIKLTDPATTVERRTEVKIISDNVSATFEVIQKANEKEIEVMQVKIVSPPLTMMIGEKTRLEIEIIPEHATVKEVTWHSSDDKIISVGSEGNIEAFSVGSASIKVAVNDKTAECQISVLDPENVLTFELLSKTDNSGVTMEDQAYVVSKNIEIAEDKILRLSDNITVKIKDEVEITVNGTLDFTPSTSALVTQYDNNSNPKSIYLTGDASGGNIQNVTFINVPVRLYANHPVTIDNCEFKEISSTRAAIDMGTNKSVIVTHCRFIENDYSAISGAANSATPLVFRNNYLYKNSANARNRPQINITVGGDGLVEISDNEVIGPGVNTTNGGIAVSNLLGIPGSNNVLVEGNKVSDCRYGITTNGLMDIRIIKNELINNKYEENPMNGGSGVSVYNNKGGQKVFISENTIQGNLWGITLIGDPANGTGPEVNMGNLTEGNQYNIGKNLFRENGHAGVLYELYNNSPIEVSAVNNHWGLFEQTEEEIEKVVFHKTDDNTLGKVTFMPPFIP